MGSRRTNPFPAFGPQAHVFGLFSRVYSLAAMEPVDQMSQRSMKVYLIKNSSLRIAISQQKSRRQRRRSSSSWSSTFSPPSPVAVSGTAHVVFDRIPFRGPALSCGLGFLVSDIQISSCPADCCARRSIHFGIDFYKQAIPVCWHTAPTLSRHFPTAFLAHFAVKLTRAAP
jgi:hypothetical protein